jgi:uroporphyrinogen-III synthase
VLYRNQPVRYDSLPEFDAVFFASASAVEAYVSQWSIKTLHGKIIAAIGQPTRKGLSRHGLDTSVVGKEATVASTIEALAAECVKDELETLQ